MCLRNRSMDRGYRENLDADDQRDKQTYDRHWSHDRYRSDYDKRDRDKDRDRKRGRDSPDQDRYRKNRSDDRNGPPQPKMSKNERRQLFEMKVAQEEEEERQRRQQEELWQQQQQELSMQQLSMEAANYSAQNGFPCYFDPVSQTWLPYHADPNMMQPQPGLDMRPPDIGSNAVYPPNPNNQPFMFNQNHHPPFVDPTQPPPTFQHPGGPIPPVFNHPPPNMQNPHMPPPKPALLPTPPILPKPPHLANPPNIQLQTPPPCFTPEQQNPFQPPLPPTPQFVQPPPQFQPPPPLPSNPQPNPLPTFQPPLPQTTISQSPTSTTPQFQPPLPKTPQFSQPNYQSPQPTTVAYTETQPTTVAYTETQPTTVAFTETSRPPPAVPLYIPTPVRLPPKWKSAKDSEGRVYYYHVKKRVSQWEPPVWEQPPPHESESSSESSDTEEEEESSSEDEEEEEEEIEKVDEEEEEDQEVDEEEEDEIMDVSDFRSDLVIDEPEPLILLEDTATEDRKRRRENLVQERIISPRLESEKISDKKHYLEVREQIKRQKAKQKEKMRNKRSRSRSKTKSRSGTSQCEADTSSDPVRRIKDTFRLNMAGVIVHYLNPYRKPDCKSGRITNTEDFKHLARKLTHFVMLKELKHCRSVEDLECNDNVKHKARDFIKKYMAKFGPVYQRPSDDD